MSNPLTFFVATIAQLAYKHIRSERQIESCIFFTAGFT